MKRGLFVFLAVVFLITAFLLDMRGGFAAPLNRPLRIAINTWGGYAPGLLANNGTKPSTDCLFFKQYGLKVEFIVIEDWDKKAAAFASGKVDLVGTTADAFANQFVNLQKSGVETRAFLLHDWSKGGDGIVARKEIKAVEGLKGKKIATTRQTPSHFLLTYLLSHSKLSKADMDGIKKNLVFVDDASRAAQLFVAGKVDAAVTWEPDLSRAVNDGNGHRLVTTATSPDLIGDVLVVRKEIAEKYPEVLVNFVKGWFDAVAQIKKDSTTAYGVTAKALSLTQDDVKGMLAGLTFTNYDDNMVFFGLQKGSGAMTPYEKLFAEASKFWVELPESAVKKPASGKDTVNLEILRKVPASYASKARTK